MTAFEIIKDAIDIEDAAERYGIAVNRHHKALCPFHDDHFPSLSFKGQRFKCFVCGAGGDVIDLVGRLENLLPLEAVRALNALYHLQLDLDQPVPSHEVQRRESQRQEKQAFAQWEQWAMRTLAGYFRQLREWRAAYAPGHPREALHPLFAEALSRQDYIEYILHTVFIEGGMSEKRVFYLSSRGMVEEVAQRMGKEQNAYVRGIAAGDNPSGIVFPFELTAAPYAEKAA